MDNRGEHADYPHEAGTLYDCAACESSCHCTPDASECVWVGHDGDARQRPDEFSNQFAPEED